MKWRPCRAAKAWSALVTATAVGLFAWQVALNVRTFLARPTVFLVDYEPIYAFRLPPVTVCPHPVFEPALLMYLGVNVSGNFVEVEERLLSLAGLEGGLRTSQLWQDSPWRFGQVVQMVMLGKGSVNYKRNMTEAPDWRRSFSPLGPCFTYIPPVGETSIKIGLHKVPYVEPCSWINDRNQTVTYYGSSSHCRTVKEKCNSTCGLENYIFYRQTNFVAAFVYFHTTSVYDALKHVTDKNIFEFSDQLFGGNYILKRLLYTPSLRSQTHQVETSLAKGNCVYSTSTYTKCHLDHQRAQALQNLGCLPVHVSTFDQPIDRTCSSPNLIQDLFELIKGLDSCPRSCSRRRWEHVVSDSWGPDFMIILDASSTDLRREKEVETYPLTQLFADIGGSLGLFLGISLLFVWEVGVRTMFSDKKGDLRNVGKVLKYTGILLMCLATCVHCLQELKTFIFQPLLTAVYLTAPTSDASDLTSALARRLASRALDCRPREPPLTECLVQCLLERAAKDVRSTIPYISVGDLPFCQHLGFTLPSFDYIVPSETLLVASSSDLVESCSDLCHKRYGSNLTSSDQSFMRVDKNYRSYSSLRLICSLAGIIGLYLGVSVFQAIDFCDRRWFLSDESKPLLVHLRRFIKLIIFACGLIILLLRCQGFLQHHEVSTSIMQDRAHRQVLTVCRWPPIDFTQLANLSLGTVFEMPLKQRQEAVLRRLGSLEDLVGSLEEVLDAAAWNLSDVIGGFSIQQENGMIFGSVCDSDSTCDEIWRPVTTPLNRCFSMNTTLGNQTFTEMLIYFSEDVEKKDDVLGLAPQIFFLLHPLGSPPLLTDMVAKQPSTREIVSVFSATYEPLGKTRTRINPLSYESCVQRCVDTGLGALFECRLPYMEWHSSILPLCNQSQYDSIPLHFKGLEGVGRPLSSADEDIPFPLRSLEADCFVSCRAFRRTFSTSQREGVPSRYPSLTVRTQVDMLRTSETDMSTLAQLVSDIGGIAGVSVGFSLLLFRKREN